MRKSELFVAKFNIEFFKMYSVSTSDMDKERRGERDWACAYIFLDKGRSICHYFV